MNRLVALNSAAHRQLRVDQAQVLAQAAQLNMLPVVLGEFLKLCVQYPIVLTKNAATGRFSCIALFGFDKHENLFWQQGRWDAIYVPLQVTRQPFFLGDGANDQDKVVCIDTQNVAVTQTHGELLFDEHGAETGYLRQVKQMLAALLEGEQQTERFVGKLLALELIRPMRLEIEFVDRRKQRVEGLYSIDEERLKGLPGESVAELHALDWLAPLYTMLASLGHIYSLVQRKNQCLL
ncbi:SapC family protein [Steroidobacter sp. S1-65]|uniref:SapC family protein n=1 Tax=Steroidobacter gossypii TaxID=2805490 RepID=A0ABS1X0L6_9GAMM|nr:SapC family protein [Steroidobacter gossypii]MBM0106757.1 SapC family protein [Steroidobacter gossypii]